MLLPVHTFTALVIYAAATTALSIKRASDHIVDLGYGRYQGIALPNGITQWLGIRYAAAPVGKLRFRAPHNPVVNRTLQVANKVCPLLVLLAGALVDIVFQIQAWPYLPLIKRVISQRLFGRLPLLRCLCSHPDGNALTGLHIHPRRRIQFTCKC